MSEFRDLFSRRAGLYSKYRPRYPLPLFEWVAGLVERHRLAWDCATGNGQAATGLAAHFDNVIATDASEKQIAAAVQHPGVSYRIATAYDSGIDDRAVDLVTVAQALHWLNAEMFYSEAKRVLHAGGAIAIWGYGDPLLDSERLDTIVRDYNRGTIENYWMPERAMLLDGYGNIPFPFREVPAPTMTLECSWTLDQLAGYMRTWSATANYAAAHGGDPVAAVEAALGEHWGPPDTRRLVRWPLHIRAGYV
ncbi:MAG TPA: class I SAM-dependent methyltransferase [Gemmatimonadaceae bacterium]|nr:class I SAM-dependent methyltransferase [Gemmatimonadaceae bacterium]